jgi:anthranilate synthase component I
VTLAPTPAEFLRLAAGATVVPVGRELSFDTETAVTAYHKIARPPFGFLLESAVGGERWARYTLMGTEPRAAWRLFGRRIEHWTPGAGWEDAGEAADPLAEFQRLLASERPAAVEGLPRFWGGAVGFFGYDTVRLVERLPSPPPDDLGLPDAVFMLTGAVLVVDNLLGRARVVVAVPTGGVSDSERLARYEGAQDQVERLIERLRGADGPALLDPPLRASVADGPFTSTVTRESFEASVRRIQEYVRAGDAFQVVLSQRLTLPLEAEPFRVYRALRALNPSPYLFFLELDGVRLVGSSPEVMVRLEEGVVTVRPIAGTRARGGTAAEDERLAEELRRDPKEVAEHLMLLDLGRNDVGRVARWGTVRVTERMAVERYSHVLHLVSTVEGVLREGLTAMDVFRASFPAGTVSGAPKVRAMEIIDELEPVRRGPYAGAVGHFGYGGRSMDLAIAIRTLVAAGGAAHVQAGAGVVADSVPASEYEETLNKARALLRAVGAAGGGFERREALHA